MSRPPLSPEETEEHSRRFIAATFRVIASTGEASPSIRPILTEAGLSRQALYRCFPSKDDLMAAVLAEGRRLLAEYLEGRIAREATPDAKVRAWVAGMMRQAEAPDAADRTRPFIASLGEGIVSSRVDMVESEQELARLLEDALVAGVADGLWGTADPAGDALRIHDFVLGSLRRHLLLRQTPTAGTTRALGDFALRGIGGSVPARLPATA